MLHCLWIFLEIFQNHLFLPREAARFFKNGAACIFFGDFYVVFTANLGQQQAKTHTTVGNGFSLCLGVVIHAFISGRMIMLMVVIMVVVVVVVVIGSLRVHRPRN